MVRQHSMAACSITAALALLFIPACQKTVDQDAPQVQSQTENPTATTASAPEPAASSKAMPDDSAKPAGAGSDSKSPDNATKAAVIEPVLQGERCRALLVGVNAYEQLKHLNFCEEDVSALRDRLVELGFDRKSVKCLTTGDIDPANRPNRRNISEALDALFAGMDKDSVLVIALSGHGGSFEWRDASGQERKESFFCPQDARLGDPHGTMISVRSIYDRLEKCPARFKLLLTDACRDPHFVADDALLAGRTAINESKSMVGFADSVKSLNTPQNLPKGTLAVVSCSSGERSWEDRSLKHGIFMYYVLEALSGHADREYRGNRNGVVSYSEFKDYVYLKTSKRVWQEHGRESQTPNFYTNWELPNFDLVKVDCCPVELLLGNGATAKFNRALHSYQIEGEFRYAGLKVGEFDRDNRKTYLFLDGEIHAIEGPYLSVGKQRLVIGASQGFESPSVEFLAGNGLIDDIEPDDFVVMQSNGSGEIIVETRLEQGRIPKVTGRGNYTIFAGPQVIRFKEDYGAKHGGPLLKPNRNNIGRDLTKTGSSPLHIVTLDKDKNRVGSWDVVIDNYNNPRSVQERRLVRDIAVFGDDEITSLNLAFHRLSQAEQNALKREVLKESQQHKPAAPSREITNSIGMKLVLIPGGDFFMGNSHTVEEEAAAFKTYGIDVPQGAFKNEYPRHHIKITRPFYLGVYEVTRSQFHKFVEEEKYVSDADKKGAVGWNSAKMDFEFGKQYSWNRVGFEQTDDHPVVNVSWDDAVAFCHWLSRKEGKVYRLPTEAEWEYACRAGTTTRYFSGDDPELLARDGNVADATARQTFPRWKEAIRASDGYVFTSPAGRFRPNAFGLYDMHGNASEWCSDWHGYDYYSQSPEEDPLGPNIGAFHILRGGAWNSAADAQRSCGVRPYFLSDSEFKVEIKLNPCYGFRVVREK